MPETPDPFDNPIEENPLEHSSVETPFDSANEQASEKVEPAQARNGVSNRMPIKPLVVGFVVLDLIILGALAFFMTKQSPNQGNVAISAVTIPTPAVMTPQPGEQEMEFTLYLPNDNALLSPKKVKHEVPSNATYGQKANIAAQIVLDKIAFVPEGSKLLGEPKKDDKGVVQLNFNKKFLGLEHQSETPIMLTFDALAHTLGALEKDGKPAKLQILVEGKTVSEFGEFDLSQPWKSTQPQGGDAM